MKIAVVLPGRLPVPATKGGAVETLTDLFIKQNEIDQDFEIVLFCRYDHESYLIAKDMSRVKVRHVKPSMIENLIFIAKRVIRKMTNKPIKTSYLSRLLKELKKEDFEKIIVENAYEYILPINKKFPQKEIIFHVHNHIFDSDIGGNNPNQVLKVCDKVIVVSNYIKRYLLSTTNNIFESKIHVLKNAIDIKKFNITNKAKQNEFRVKNGIEKNDFVFLFCGRIVPEKGVKELIIAFKKVLKKYPYCKLLIVGSTGNTFAYSSNKSTYLNELYSLATEHPDKIIFTGFIHNDELANIHAISNVLVVPSRYQEAAGLVNIEAQASGLAVIASNIGGIPEYLDKKICRLIQVDNHFTDNISNEMISILEEPIDHSISAKKYSYNYDKTQYYVRFSKFIRS